MNDNKRILFLDYARIFAAFLVVFYHMYTRPSSVRLYLSAFLLPLFFLISGFLHSPRTSKDELFKYFRTIFVPILFFTLVGAVIRVLLIHGNLVDILYKSLGAILYGKKLTANTFMWFLFALLDVKLMMYFYLKLKKAGGISVTGHLFLVLIWGGIMYACKLIPVNPLYFKNAIMAFPFYFIGFISVHGKFFTFGFAYRL